MRIKIPAKISLNPILTRNKANLHNRYYAQSEDLTMGSYTTKLNLYKPAVGETGWGALVNTNFDTIDAITPAQIGAEPAFTKNGAFNKNFGTASGTVCQGNDSRLSDSRTPKAHASTATTYGASSASNYGHAMASSTTPKAAGTAAVGSETAKFARGDHVHPAQTTVSGSSGSCTGNAATATTLATARTIGISGGATGTATSFNGSANITIPVTALDASKLSAGTVPAARLPEATTSALGAVKVGSGLKVSSGTVSVDSSAIITSYPMYARLTDTDEGVGTLIKNNVYNGTLGQLPMGIMLYNPDDTHTVTVSGTAYSEVSTTHYCKMNFIAKNVITLETRTMSSDSITVYYKSAKTVTKTFDIRFDEIITINISEDSTVYLTGTSCPINVYFGVGL